MEGYAYTKKGSIKTVTNVLEAIIDKFDRKEMFFSDVDEAILLANAITEVYPPLTQGRKDSDALESLFKDLLQRSMSCIGSHHVSQFKYIDQWVLIFNSMLSKYVVNGEIDLTQKESLKSIYEDGLVESDDEQECLYEIFHPDSLFKKFESISPMTFN